MLTAAARLVVEDGHEPEAALRRAARELKVNLNQRRPRTDELQEAIREHRALFRPDQATTLARQRRVAREAMQSFAAFAPQLFGSLVRGDGRLDLIRLMLFADATEEVLMHLRDRHIPWRESETLLNYSGGRRLPRPALRFQAGDSTVELVIMERRRHGDPPRDPLDGGPLATLGIDELDALLAASDDQR